MTVPVQNPFTSSVANGVTTVFPYSFMIADEDDLKVVVDGVVQTTGYTVSGVGSPSGGNVTFAVAPANNLTVLRYLDPILKREIDYQQFGDLLSDTINLDFDKVWLALQALQQNFKRSLKLPIDTATDQTISEDAAARVGLVVSFDASGNMMLAAPADLSLQTVSTFIATLLDDLNAASARATLGARGTSDDVLLAAGKVVVFEGATDDAFETTLTVVDPTADQTITLPNMSGQAAVQARGSDIASASTINLTTATGDIVDVTGTTGITAVTLSDGLERKVRFAGALTLTNGASLVLPGGANITTAAGDFAVFRGYAAGVVRCVSYQKANGQSVATGGAISAGSTLTQNPYAASATVTQAHGLSGRPQIHDVYLECITADAGYAVGDKVLMPTGSIGGGATSFIVYSDATNVYLNTVAGSTPTVPHKTTHTNTAINVANWKLIVKPFYIP